MSSFTRLQDAGEGTIHLLSISKKQVPPGLPEPWRGRLIRHRCGLLRLLLVARANHNDNMFARTSIAQLLASLALNHVGILIVLRLPHQVVVFALQLLNLLLRLLQTLRKLIVRPGLDQRAEQESQTDQARYPDNRRGKEGDAPRARPALGLLYTHC